MAKNIVKESLTVNVKVPESRLICLRHEVKDKYEVDIDWDESRTKLSVKGVAQEVRIATDYVKSEVEICKIRKYKIRRPQSLFFQNNTCEDITAALMKLDVPHFIENESNTIVIIFKGLGPALREAIAKLEELESQVKVCVWDINKEFQNEDELKLIRKSSDTELREDLQVLESQSKEIVTDLSPVTVSSLIYNLTDCCRLIIKNCAGITEENSDVLVCPLAEKPHLTSTRVFKALNRQYPTLREKLEKEVKKNPRNPIYVVDKQMIPNLRCQCIIFVTLQKYKEREGEYELTNLLNRLLSMKVVADSISFPPLGHGKALKYPPATVASTMIGAFKTTQGCFKRITVLAPETVLFNEFKSELEDILQNIPTYLPGHGDAGPVSLPSDVSDYGDDYQFRGAAPDNEGSELMYFPSHGETERDNNDDDTRDGRASNSNNLSYIHIAGRDMQTVNNFKAELTKLVTDKYLYTDTFYQEVLDSWPDESKNAIISQTKTVPVLVKLTTKPLTDTPSFKVQGKKESVTEMMKFIRKEFDKQAQKIPIRRIISPQAPPRGTVEFMKHAATSNEPFPSYWRQEKTFRDLIRYMFGHPPLRYNEITVDKATKTAITDLVTGTWKEDLVGRSVDAAGLGHSGIRVTDVKRIQNPRLFQEYSAQRKRLFYKMSARGQICSDIAQLRGSSGEVATTKHLDDSLKKELYHEINEHYLLRGVTTDTAEAVMAAGFHPKVPEHSPMLGKGIYLTESSTKADQTADVSYSRSGKSGVLTLIMARVVLGNVYLCKEAEGSEACAFREINDRPCMKCLRDRCSCPDQEFYDSVVRDGAWNFREFVVYDVSYCYPEYVIRYQRV